ncbi:MAG: non-canonical purine NTP pyrophosphatase [Candidatus Eremiobacteraeota bacterium]|nr:non-canonical purine NTP pyrophosphatase [Candidatus Eremiobacteraeota bacterium]
MKRLFVATKNAGKLRELRAIFARGYELETYPLYDDVEEGETSYAENAALKARALHAQLEAAGLAAAVLGDDSGLEVAVLDGRPGVLSARYAGVGATWAERRRTLLDEIGRSRSVDRSARFFCALHYIEADGREWSASGEVAGVIAGEEVGRAGFSYDSIFALSAGGPTFAEMRAEEKNAISHRARAVSGLFDALNASARGAGNGRA